MLCVQQLSLIHIYVTIFDAMPKLGGMLRYGIQMCIRDSSITFEMLSEEEKEAEKKRAVAQGADPAYVARTEGYPGVIVELDTGREGPFTALRFDIDCLPYQEPKKEGFRPFDEGYISCNDGCVHACGHDAHRCV